MHHDTFNADFYITAATVIPIFYLALTLQGQTYQEILTRLKDSSHLESLTATLTSFVMLMAGFLIVFYGILGELLAIIALYERKPPSVSGGGTNVLISMIGLLAAVTIGPALRLLLLFYRALIMENPPSDS